MATYKVLQDIEAEDKFVGPLTLKQFIFMAITAMCLYLSIFALTKGVWVVGVLLLPIIVVGSFLGFPWGRDQPTEVWLLAKLRYLLKPRKRIWDQSGIKELVHITVPKHIVQDLTNNLSQSEVKSRLRALAQTIDSRGWAVKNVSVNMFTEPSYAAASDTSDRLIAMSSLPQITPTIVSNVDASDDIFSNQHADLIASQIDQSSALHKSDIKKITQAAAKPDDQKTPAPDFWFMNQPDAKGVPDGNMVFEGQTVSSVMYSDDLPVTMRKADQATEADAALLKSAHVKASKNNSFSHRRRIDPAWSQPTSLPKLPPLTNNSDPAILNLARDNNRNVDSLAREANQISKKRDLPDDEVVISLH